MVSFNDYDKFRVHADWRTEKEEREFNYEGECKRCGRQYFLHCVSEPRGEPLGCVNDFVR